MNGNSKFFLLGNRETEEETVQRIGDSSDIIDKSLYSSYSSNLRSAIDQVYHGESNKTANLMRVNVSRFSAYKAAVATSDIRNELHITGSLSDATNILRQYNTFQATEYNTTVARARTAKQWEQFNESDNLRLFPNLRWLPSRSAEPREAHRQFWNRVWPKGDPFWKTNFPGNIWNCKCDWEETMDDCTDSTPKNENAPQTSMPGLDTNPGDKGEIFSDNASYIKNVTSIDRAMEIEKDCNYLESIINIKDEQQKALLTLKTGYCVDRDNQVREVFLERFGYEECFGKMISAPSETYLSKNEIVKNWDKYLEKATYEDWQVNDMGHNSIKQKRNRFKRKFDYFYYYKVVMDNGEIAYFHVGHNSQDDKFYLWAITTQIPNFSNSQ